MYQIAIFTLNQKQKFCTQSIPLPFFFHCLEIYMPYSRSLLVLLAIKFLSKSNTFFIIRNYTHWDLEHKNVCKYLISIIGERIKKKTNPINTYQRHQSTQGQTVQSLIIFQDHRLLVSVLHAMLRSWIISKVLCPLNAIVLF